MTGSASEQSGDRRAVPAEIEEQGADVGVRAHEDHEHGILVEDRRHGQTGVVLEHPRGEISSYNFV